MFDFDRESPSFIQAAYCLVYYVIFFVLCYKDYYTCIWVRTNHIPKLSTPIIILFFIFTLTYFIDTDYFHYYSYIKKISQGYNILTIEPIYKTIASIVQYQYLLFRAVVWGSAMTILYFTSRKAHIKPDYVLYFLFVMYFGLFAYARASLAMAIVYFGFYYWDNSRQRLSLKLMGLFIMCISVAFHSSMVLALICCLTAPLLKWTKSRILIYILAIPVISLMIKFLLNWFINSGSTESMVINKLIFYSETSGPVERTLLGELRNNLQILAFVCPLFFIGYRVYFRNIVKNIKALGFELDLFKISFLLLAISFAFLKIGLDTEVFSYRIRFMAMIPIVYSFIGLLQKKVIKIRDAQICLIIGFIYTIMGMLYTIKHA